MPNHSPQDDGETEAQIAAIKQRAENLVREIDADKAHFDRVVSREQEKSDRMSRRFAPVHAFGYTSKSLRIPGWLAALIIAIFVGVLLWAALQET